LAVSLKDQVVLVVGASSGIGRAAAVLFAHEGAKVMASARRLDRLRGLQDQLSEEGHPIEVSAADASKPREMDQLAERTLAKFGKVDIMVFATGTNTPDRSLKRLDERFGT
jgi:Short-chain alcohol dehydrogenase of unknown specificity